MRKKKPLSWRFWEKVRKEGDCWVWTAAKLQPKMNYGLFAEYTNPTRYCLAHRMAYRLTCGPIPDGLVVMHKCDNPRCVKPTHLSVGTREENNKDAARKGRTPRGENHKMAKLNREKVLEIRKLYAEMGSYTAVSKLVCVSSASVRCLILGITWKHVL